MVCFDQGDALGAEQRRLGVERAALVEQHHVAILQQARQLAGAEQRKKGVDG